MNTHHDPINVLMHEHEFIKKVVAALGRLAPSPDKAKDANPDTLREIVRFMREFADRCHHAKEEDLLFPAMEDKGVPESGCPLESLLKEHQKGRALVTALSEAAEALAAGKPEAAGNLAEAVGEITNLYTNHIWKEDEMVFPMVGRLFTDDEREVLFKRFEQAETEIGADHEALAEFADKLDRETSRD